MRKAGARIMTTNDITNSAPVVRKAVDGSVIPAVKAVQVHKAFGPLHVLKGIDLTVMPGTVTVILGPSGSGKSTFLRLINQLETLTGGSIEVDGELIGYKHVTKNGQDMLRMDDKDCRLATLCGMSALFSALFGTPLAAVFFALEVVSIGVLYYSGLIPCITSSLVAYAVSLRFGIEPMRFAVAAPETDALTLARAAVLALGCALVSILFCEMLHRTEHLTERLVKNNYLRAFLGGCLVIALTLLAGCRDYNGAGGHVIAAALGGTAKPEAFLLKIVFTAVTLGCGFKGGEIVPTLFVGSTFGCAAGALLGLPAGFAAALGITGLFCGMTNCPLTSLLISVELFGADGLLCYAVVCAVSYVCSGYRGLYSSQTILYSKLRAEFINVHTK